MAFAKRWTAVPGWRRFCLPVLAVAFGMASGAAQADLSFQLDRAQAAPGETFQVVGLFVNDGNTAEVWQLPTELVLQWRGLHGETLRSVARLAREADALNIPVGQFAQARWNTAVPDGMRGLQAIHIEGHPALLALETASDLADSVLAQQAQGPVIDPQTGQEVRVEMPSVILTEQSVSSQRLASAASPLSALDDPEQALMDHLRSAMSPYEPVYFSLGAKDDFHARFQLSFKYRLFSPVAEPVWWDKFYFAYTQTSIWDLGQDSSPFRDSSYRPAFFWLNERVLESEDQRHSLGMNLGFEHESNGRSADMSRSMNSLYLRPSFNYRFENGSLLSFSPRIKHFMSLSDNPDIRDYRGRVDYQLKWISPQGYMASAAYRDGSRKGHLQLDFAYPLKGTWLRRVNGFIHLQYVKGYGETLLDYNRKADSQFRLGLMIVR